MIGLKRNPGRMALDHDAVDAEERCGGPIVVEACDGVTARFDPTPACRRNSDQ